jgi:hypothetical protein
VCIDVEHIATDRTLGRIEGDYTMVTLAFALLFRLDGFIPPGPLAEQGVTYIGEAGGSPTTLLGTQRDQFFTLCQDIFIGLNCLSRYPVRPGVFSVTSLLVDL